MNVFRRMADIFNSNVNSALDKMEDPKKMINLMIAEMEETEIQIRGSIAEKTAELTTLKREMNGYLEAENRWAERARLAVEKENDELAKEAIIEKKKATEKAEILKASITTLENILISMKEQLEQVQTKLVEMKTKRTDLLNRAQAAKEKIKTNETLKEADSAKYMQRFEELQARIEKWEAEAKVFSSTTTGPKSTRETFEDMEREKAINDELSALKASMNKKEEN